MKKVNIDECYVVLISRYKGYEREPKNNVLLNFDNVKFTIVKYEGFGIYKDIITDEVYDKKISEYNEKGILFVRPNYLMLPLSSLVNSKNNIVSKKKLLEKVRQPLIELINLLHSKDRNKLISAETIENTFKDVDLNKSIRGINTEKLYIASLREVTHEEEYERPYFSCTRHYHHSHHNFVIVKKCLFKKGKFKDLRFGNVYKNIEDCHLHGLGLYSEFIWPFNYKTGNKEKRLPYVKVLSLFHDTADYLTKKHNL